MRKKMEEVWHFNMFPFIEKATKWKTNKAWKARAMGWLGVLACQRSFCGRGQKVGLLKCKKANDGKKFNIILLYCSNNVVITLFVLCETMKYPWTKELRRVCEHEIFVSRRLKSIRFIMYCNSLVERICCEKHGCEGVFLARPYSLTGHNHIALGT